ncbi:MAG: N-6 DNA methylase [bacterium]|nr:N-6 DNA methylase [bacterium]MDE0287270.1 N-6 DNA methylase [bacterium]MDE0438995.1 N-6 DNA methylase [bacterium]
MAKKNATAQTTRRAELADAVSAARNAMRKDAGLNGELDRISQLAWLLFLKAFDSLEQDRETTDPGFRPAIDAPYRWRDWAADPDGRTGESLISFIEREFTDDRGVRRRGLLPYLRDLAGTGSNDSRAALRAIFKEADNRMFSGYLLRVVVDHVEEIDFASSDAMTTMAYLYETMLRDAHDAAGGSGSFYTPRPVIRFMVEQIAPQLGEVILDPACGTGGFLVEALEYLRPGVGTAEEYRRLHENLRGVERSSLPYLLGVVNMLLRGVGEPNLVRGDALAKPIAEISRADQVDVIVTNPPFGGLEMERIQNNFPAYGRTAATEWLFIQLLVRRLKDRGRCAMVVPNRVLVGSGVGARIKEQLLEECNLHTVVRLPAGVLEPSTAIPFNLLFFEKTGRTKETWFYEIRPPKGRKKYTKTIPIRFEEFARCRSWWKSRVEDEFAWRVPVEWIQSTNFNLDLTNPSEPLDLANRPPAELLRELIEVESEVLRLLKSLEHGFQE